MCLFLLLFKPYFGDICSGFRIEEFSSIIWNIRGGFRFLYDLIPPYCMMLYGWKSSAWKLLCAFPMLPTLNRNNISGSCQSHKFSRVFDSMRWENGGTSKRFGIGFNRHRIYIHLHGRSGAVKCFFKEANFKCGNQRSIYELRLSYHPIIVWVCFIISWSAKPQNK